MKYLFSIIFLLVFSFAAYGQSQCPVMLSPNAASVSYAGSYNNYFAIDVTTASDCTWTATRADSWIEFLGSATQTAGSATISRTGSARFYIAAGPNNGDPRQTSITVNNQTIPVTQNSGCIYSVQNSNQNFDAAGGARSYPGYRNGGGPGGCRVTYTTDVDWIHLGVTDFTVDANTNAARNGTIFYNYSSSYRTPFPPSVSVNQAAGMPAPTPTPTPTPTPACTYALGTLSQSFTSSGGTGLVDIQTQAGCAYSAAVSDAFITITSGANGNGTIFYNIAANTGAARTGTITAGGQTFTVNQAARTKSRIRRF
jgi:hypothetical protein